MTSSGGVNFFSNALGGSKDNDDHRKSRFENLPKQNRFFELKHQRDAQRLLYIRQGILPDPDKAQDLSAAKSLLGTCLEMCPEFEREEREFQNEGDTLEMVSLCIGRKREEELTPLLPQVSWNQSHRSGIGSKDIPPASCWQRTSSA